MAETGPSPLEYLCSVFRDETQPQAVRLDAAKAAAPYLHAKLNTIEAKVDQTTVIISQEEEERRRQDALAVIDAAFAEVVAEL